MLCFLAAGAAECGILYHVRIDGSDSCDGRADAPSGVLPASCAFRTIQAAVDAAGWSAADNDDIVIHPGVYEERVVLKPSMKGLAGNPIVLQGDPGAPRSEIRIACPAASSRECLLSPGGPTSSTRSEHFVIQHLAIDAGTCHAVRLGDIHGRHVLRDLLIDRMPAIGRISFGRGCPAGVRAHVIRQDSNLAGFTWEEIRVQGSRDPSLASYVKGTFGGRTFFEGTDAGVFYINGSHGVIRNVVATDMAGQLTGDNGAGMLIEHNRLIGTMCSGDDGCVQIYNSQDDTLRYNVFDKVWLDPNMASVGIKIRSTFTGGSCNNLTGLCLMGTQRVTPCVTASDCAAAPNNPEVSFAHIHNNTLIGQRHMNPIALDPGSRMTAFYFDSTLSGSPSTEFINNIVAYFGNAVRLGAATVVAVCPPSSPLELDYNWYHANLLNRADPPLLCVGEPWYQHDVVAADPRIDPATYAPGNPAACSGASTTHADPDGQMSSPFFGAVPCGSFPVVPPERFTDSPVPGALFSFADPPGATGRSCMAWTRRDIPWPCPPGIKGPCTIMTELEPEPCWLEAEGTAGRWLLRTAFPDTPKVMLSGCASALFAGGLSSDCEAP